MDESRELSEIIGEFYDASLDPALWPDAIGRAATFVGGTFANLFSQDETRKTAALHYSRGISPEFHQLYMDKYIKVNPLFPATLFFEVGRVIHQDDIVPRHEWLGTTFYREWAQPLGMFDALACVLEKSATSCAVFAIGRTERDGYVDDEAKHRMALLIPHVRRALAIGKVIDLHKVEAAALADVLDGLAAGTFLLDAEARIVHANASGLRMIENGQTVRAMGGRLFTNDPQVDRSLRDALAAAAVSDAAVDLEGAALSLPARDGSRHLAHILPLMSGARRKGGTTYAAVAAVFICKAEHDSLHPVEALAKAYKLTPAEMRVLMMIVQIGGIPEVAPILGVSETTVKTHLHRIFAKTGLSRQADLAKLVMGYLSPLAMQTSQ